MVTTSTHEFVPRTETRDLDDFVVAACSCGWTGDAYPQADGGYDDARLEHGEHVAGLGASVPEG